MSNAFSDRYFCYDTKPNYETKWGAYEGDNKLFETKTKPEKQEDLTAQFFDDLKKSRNMYGIGVELSSVSEMHESTDGDATKGKKLGKKNLTKM